MGHFTRAVPFMFMLAVIIISGFKFNLSDKMHNTSCLIDFNILSFGISVAAFLVV